MIELYLIANSADTDEMQHPNLGLYLMYLCVAQQELAIKLQPLKA